MITLAKIANLLKEHQLVREFIIDNEWHYAISEDVAESTISHITYDSRAIKEGSLFFCKGLAFKSDYLEQAIADGAGFYVTEVNYEIQSDAVGIIVTDIKKAMALISMAFYDFPQDELKVIAYTGTKGKTTAAYFCKYILEKATNQKTALLSTMETILDGKTSIKSLLTTPESVDLYRMMREAVSNGMSHLVMEVSSQAYKTDRVYGLNFDVGIFLNISEDHIGTIEHPDFDDYFYCKRQLLKHSKQVILNKNSDFYAILEDVAKESTDKVITYGDDSVEADYTFIPSSEGKGKFEVVAKEADFGIVVDPDVDRLAFITEKGEMFGEEYTLVACADYILSKNKGNVVSNLSSSRALRDIAKKHGVQYAASAVGEVNVVAKMKEVNAIIGGEGNGGIIFPELHYGRDALVGVALFLSLLTDKNISVSALRKSYPAYYMSKNKIELSAGLNPDKVLAAVKERYAHEPITTIDGVKIDFANSWVHLRKSNTEPIIRIYTEAKSQEEADALAQRFLEEMKELAN